MEWFVLLFVSLLYAVGAYMTYTEEARKQWWFIPFAVGLGAVVSTLWFLMVRWLDDKQRIYVYSLFWDAIMIAVYYFLPPLIFGVKLDKWSLVGLALIVGGVALIKVRS